MLKGTKKVMYNAYERWLKSREDTINKAYKNPSSNKLRAYEYCLAVARRYNGTFVRIVSHNTFTFSVAFMGEYEGKKAFFYITPAYDRYIWL